MGNGMTTSDVQHANSGKLASHDHRQQQRSGNPPPTDYLQNRTITQLFESQVERAPEAIALSYRDETLSYRQLNQRANRLAHYLLSLKLSGNAIIGICMDRSADMIAGLLAILKAGGAYLPLDPDLPPERWQQFLADAQVPALLTDRSLKRPVDNITVIDTEAQKAHFAWQSIDNPRPANSPSDLAYVNYTSGSTGRPKGVAIRHQNVTSLLFGIDYVSLGADNVLLHMAPTHFDATTFEIWGALLHGGRCVLFPGKLAALSKLKHLLEREAVSTLFLTTALFNTIIDEKPTLLKTVKQLLTGGEAHSPAHMRKALDTLVRTDIISVYGPTECTTFATYHRVTREDCHRSSIPIGRPIANTQTYILDKQRQLCPPGVAGELHIGGDGLAAGYLHRQDLTDSRFITGLSFLPPSTVVYKTGDQACYLDDSRIDFIGRLDNQVKIHGFRIELGEIEVKLMQHGEVSQAVVVLQSNRYDDKQLIAFLIADSEKSAGGAKSSIDGPALKSYLVQSLPHYMIPYRFHWLHAFPLTVNGKVDRKALSELRSPNQDQASLGDNTLIREKNMTLSKSAQRVQDAFSEKGQPFEVLELPSSTRTANDAAETIGCDVAQIVKSLIFRTKESDHPILVLASGVNRVNEKKLSRLLGEKLIKADADYTREVTGFAIGGVPPVAHAQAIRTFIDEDLVTYRELWAAAGTPNAVFSLSGAVLAEMTGGAIATIK
jgi:amino acid adenylation domain-containing protein